MSETSWVVYPKRRRQISLIKIPRYIVNEKNVKDGAPITIIITGEKGKVHYKGPVTVTSGCEIYIPNNVKKMVGGLEELKITIV